MTIVTLTVNGTQLSKSVENRTLLLQLLREHLKLTGTHMGCDTSQCGACVVEIDGRSVKSCSILAVQCQDANVVTIEGMARGDELHPLQKAFRDKHGLQCGYCTPGMIMSATDLLRNNPDPSEVEIREWLEGNICRCTGYCNIVAAIKQAASEMMEQAKA